MVSIEAINGAAKEGGPFVVMTEDRAYGFATIEECEGRTEALKDSFAVLRFLWAGGETFGSLKAHLMGSFDTSYAKAADKALAAIGKNQTRKRARLEIIDEFMRKGYISKENAMRALNENL